MHPDRQGQRVPEVVFRTRRDGQWHDLSTADVFAGKTVVVFALPGAFTPTCSTSHVPRYNELAPVFKRHGVDDIVCISVNDGFVMEAWQRDQHADRIRFLPDGNGQFTEGMGMLVDKNDLGFGRRSWRYSMLVRDGIVDKMFVERDEPGDPFHVSDADTMLDHLAPKAQRPADIVMFGRVGCQHCERAKKALRDRDMDFTWVDANLTMLRAVSGRATTPQVFVDGRHIGGADELQTYLAG
jgi:peroxiredoxin/glutaredoxin